MKEQSGEITIKDVKHVMDLLVGSLYGHDPHLTIRELIQNAHDALVDAGNALTAAEKSITIRLFAMEREPFLEVQDTGLGLTGPQVADRFGRIGDSEKLQRAIEHPELIGKFGIGFLSAFIVADRVEVLTRTRHGSVPEDEGGYWLWQTQDQSNWTLRRLTDVEAAKWARDEFAHGTRVRLYFRRQYDGRNLARMEDLRTVDGLETIIQAYCYLLPYPIRLAVKNDAGRVANLVREPWAADDLAADTFKALFGKNQPLYTWRFRRHDDATGYSAAGVLYFREQLNRTPSVQLYVKRMLVSAEDRQLIPPYGVMTSGIVECPDLEVDLSRRQVAPFDPAYKWLRQVMLEEFERAFLDMTERRFDAFLGLWPSIDNSFIVHLMDAYRNERDEPLRAAAVSFLRKAGRRLPFYMVDLISGSQGRPMWQTIDEYAHRREQELSEQQRGVQSTTLTDPIDEHGRTRVYFTSSRGPVEKDLLIEQYKELFDVGREERNHGLVFNAMQAMGADMPRVALVEVKASQFGEVEANEATRWREVKDFIQRLLVFSGRSHEVLVESFEPRTTPIMITDRQIDDDQVRIMREQLSGLAAVPGVGAELLAYLDRLAAKGGSLLIHVNTRNELMVRLREAVTTGQPEERNAGNDSLSLIAWRAVIDYFGWTSTRDMIARDREYTHNIIRGLLEASSEAGKLRTDVDAARRTADDAKAEAGRAASELAAAKAVEATADTGTTVEAICGFVDIANSTGELMANPKVAPDQRAELFRWLAARLQDQLEACGADVISFTGDGLLFLLTQQQARPNVVLAALKGMAGAIETAALGDADLATLLRDMGAQPPKLRLGLSAGQVHLGKVGPSRNVIGLPVVEAARIAEHKDLIDSCPERLLISAGAQNRGAGWGLWQAVDFEAAGTIEGRGLGQALRVYRPA